MKPFVWQQSWTRPRTLTRLSLWTLSSECVWEHAALGSLSIGEVFLINRLPQSLFISIWMFSTSLSGIRWRLPRWVPGSPAVCFSEKLAEECRLKFWFSPSSSFMFFWFCFYSSRPSNISTRLNLITLTILIHF